MADFPRILKFIGDPTYKGLIQWIGITLQEAHDADIWPIGKENAPQASFTVEDRITNTKRLFTTFPLKDIAIRWFVDVPNDSWFHVGGSFNSQFRAWPHNFYVFQYSRFVYEAPKRITSKGETFIQFQDIIDFIHATFK